MSIGKKYLLDVDGMPCFDAIDTSEAEDMTDEMLIHAVSSISMVNGWGNVAELLKRYSRDVIK